MWRKQHLYSYTKHKYPKYLCKYTAMQGASVSDHKGDKFKVRKKCNDKLQNLHAYGTSLVIVIINCTKYEIYFI